MNTINSKDVPTQLATYFTYLKDHGIRYIKIYFSGGGDDGSFEEFDLLHHTEMNDKFEELDLIGEADVPEFNLTMRDHIEKIANRYTNSYDWWNNDGGWGNFYLNIDTLEYKTDYNIYITETESYSEEGHVEI
jgi:hypothetical protein